MKNLKIYLISLVIIFYALISFGQVRSIESIISKEASDKLHYQLALAAIYHKDYLTSGKTLEDEQKYRNQLKSMQDIIAIDIGKSEPTVDVIIKKIKGAPINEDYFQDFKINMGDYFDFITARIAIKDLEEISGLEEIIGMEPSFWLFPSLNQSTSDIKAEYVWLGGNLNNPIDNCISGKNVIVGLIDTKPNFRHLTFEDEIGNSRFVEDYPLSNPDGHGTHVAGIMAGRGIWDNVNNKWNNRGVAYESKIIWREKSTTCGTIEDFQEMIEFSDTLPLIVNFSVGYHYGPRDGTTIFEQDLNNLIDGNKILVKSAGNQSSITGPFPHLREVVPDVPDDFIELNFQINGVIGEPTAIEIWHNGKIGIKIKGNNPENPDWSDMIEFGDFNTLYNVNFYSENRIVIFNSENNIYSNDTNNISNSKVISVQFQSTYGGFGGGIYGIRLYPDTINSGSVFDAYHCNLTTVGGFLNGDNYQSISVPGYSEEIITVAAHHKNQDGGDWASYSSLGPSRIDEGDQVSKPDISAPGGFDVIQNDPNAIWSAAPVLLYDWVPMSGTSMAAPHVTGAIALLMQSFPQLTASQVKEILQKSAGPIPNGNWQGDNSLLPEDRKYWGAGKLDILAAYRSMVGFNYEPLAEVHKVKFTNAYINHTYLEGLPVEPVDTDWGGVLFYKQRMTNGAIVLFLSYETASWLGEGIWNKWVEMGAYNSEIGLPIGSEYIDANNNDYPTVDFNNGRIYWNGSEAIPEIYLAYFAANNTDGGAPFSVQFNDTSYILNGNVDSWLWDFGDGETSEEQNPLHVYQSYGAYSVSMTLFADSRNYSCTKTDYIYVFENIPSTNIVEVEYFFDEDPGFGNGINLPVSPNNIVNITANIGLDQITQGLHRLYFRAKDENNKWSVIHSKPIYVTNGSGQSGLANITAIEYYFDTLSSAKGGLPISFIPSENVTANDTLELTSVPLGLHRLYFRAKDENGRWSVFHSKLLLVQKTSQNSGLHDITDVEYFFDVDPGFGNGNDLTFSPSNDVTIETAISLNNLGAGGHRLYFRAKDSNGLWGQPQYYPYSLLDLKVYLEGPFDQQNSFMRNDLFTNGLLPLHQPFNTNPDADWFYDGDENLSSISNPDIVDWVLVQYRDAATAGQATAATIKDTKPAFLLNDGRIRELDGSSLFLMNENITQNLYAVIYHRNHLGILSASPIPLTGTDAGVYDYSTSSSKVYGGTLGFKEIFAGKWGMMSGDGDGNGVIDINDKNQIWGLQSGLEGYKTGDFNLNNQVDNSDKNMNWYLNQNKESQVPE